MKERGLDKVPKSIAAEPVQEITVQEPELVSAPDNGCVPDPAISVESMNAYAAALCEYPIALTPLSPWRA